MDLIGRWVGTYGDGNQETPDYVSFQFNADKSVHVLDVNNQIVANGKFDGINDRFIQATYSYNNGDTYSINGLLDGSGKLRGTWGNGDNSSGRGKWIMSKSGNSSSNILSTSNFLGHWNGTYGDGSQETPNFVSFRFNKDWSIQVLNESDQTIANGHFNVNSGDDQLYAAYEYSDGAGIFSIAGHLDSPGIFRGVWGAGYIPKNQGRFRLTLVGTTSNLNSAIDNLGRTPPVIPGSTDLAPPTSTLVDVGGVAYLVTEQRRRIVNDVVEHAFLQDIAALGVWPGQVIQSKTLLVGDIAPIGPFPRQPGKVQIVTDLISNTPHPQSADINNPDAAKINQIRRDIIGVINPIGSAGLLKTGFERASTLREVGVKLGVTVKGAAFGVDANATLDQTYKRSVVVASIRQVYYSTTFTPVNAGAVGFWSEGAVSYQDLAPYVGSGNPPLYIDSVQYGRFICITAHGAFSSSEITGALKVTWEASVSGSVNIDARTKEILESSQIKIYTLGVPGHQNFQDITDPITQLQQVYTSGLSFSLQNPGSPISFTSRHIADGTLAHVGLAAEYTQPLHVEGKNISQRKFEVFDGPGGGLVDTRIPVNPGDKVTISAEDLIWSGVFGSGLHGPEGWPGHRADSAAPLPAGTAYCLVIRFGNGTWIEAGKFWQGSPDPESGGILQLNVNDNNPYNGDNTKRWKVKIDVTRAGAAAVGVYI
jgi:hypothetical protein